MSEWKILSKAEKGRILNIAITQWSCENIIIPEMFLLTPHNKVYLANSEVLETDFEGLRVDKLGLYFGEV